MKQTDIPVTARPWPSGVKWLEGYGTGELLTIMEAIRDIFRKRGLEVSFTARAAPKPDEPVVC